MSGRVKVPLNLLLLDSLSSSKYLFHSEASGDLYPDMKARIHWHMVDFSTITLYRMNILLMYTETETKVNTLEDTILTGPENMTRF